MKPQQFVILVAIIFYFTQSVEGQTLRLLDLFENKHNQKYNSTDFPMLGIRRAIVDTNYYSVFAIKGNKAIIKVPRNSVFEIFECRYLVISTLTYTEFQNGQPNFVKRRDSIFVIDLERRSSKLMKVYKAFINGRTVYSNSLELINTNRQIVYQYAIRSISLPGKTIKLLNLETTKDEELRLTN